MSETTQTISFKQRVITLLSEPSTYAGLAGALGGMAVLGLDSDMWMQVFGGLAILAGGIAAVKLDKVDKKNTEDK